MWDLGTSLKTFRNNRLLSTILKNLTCTVLIITLLLLHTILAFNKAWVHNTIIPLNMWGIVSKNVVIPFLLESTEQQEGVGPLD